MSWSAFPAQKVSLKAAPRHFEQVSSYSTLKPGPEENRHKIVSGFGWGLITGRHKITTTYDASTSILFNSKTFHPKQSDSNNKLKHTYNNPIFTISDMGSPTQSNGFSNGCLRIVSCETNYTKVLRVLGPIGAPVKWERHTI